MGLLWGAAPRSGPWHWRMCTPPHGRHATRPTIHVDSGHLSIRGHQVLQAISWGPCLEGSSNTPSLDSWKENTGEDPSKSQGDRTPQRCHLLELRGSRGAQLSVAEHSRERCLSVSSEDREAEAGVLPKASQQAPEPCPKDSLYPCTFPRCILIRATGKAAHALLT